VHQASQTQRSCRLQGMKTYVIGVGMTKFDKPGTKDGDYPDWVKEAGTKALEDAGIPYERVQQAFAGYCYGDSTYGQRAIYGLGLTGIPVVNVNNNCSTGSSALFLARQALKGGLVDCALAVGFEKMGARLAGHEVHRPHACDGQAHATHVRAARS
jgi:acetyl-CoA acyltransferase